MSKVRVFGLLTFSDNNVLIDYLSLAEKIFGKYDFFTQNIKYTYDLSGNYSSDSSYKIRALSFKKLFSRDRCGEILDKGEEIRKKMNKEANMHFNMIFGYINTNQVISLHTKPAPERIYLKKNLYAQIQMMVVNGRIVSKLEVSEFSVPDVKKFFQDLQILYQDQITR